MCQSVTLWDTLLAEPSVTDAHKHEGIAAVRHRCRGLTPKLQVDGCTTCMRKVSTFAVA